MKCLGIIIASMLVSVSVFGQKPIPNRYSKNISDLKVKTLILGKWADQKYNLILKKDSLCQIDWRDGVVMNSTWNLQNRILYIHSAKRKNDNFTSQIYKYKIIDISGKELKLHPIESKNIKRIIIFKRLEN